jgi:hypothetical protein
MVTQLSRAALRKAGSLVPPLLGALPVSFGIPAIRHQNLYLTDVHGVAHFGRREFDQIATYGPLPASFVGRPRTAPESNALQAGRQVGERRGYGRGFDRGGGGVRLSR